MSRGRNKAKSSRSGPRILRSVTSAPPEVCDCPECAGADFEPQELLDNLLDGGTTLLDEEDPLNAELLLAGFLAAGSLATDDFADVLAGGILPDLAQVATPASLAVLLALDAVGGTPESAAGVRRLVTAGVPAPRWSNELREPVRTGQCRRFTESEGTVSILICTFHRADRSHGFMINIDHLDCDAAADILLFPAEVLDEVVDAVRTNGIDSDLTITEEELDPAEFRWQAERALDARAVHDREVDPEEFAEGFGDDSGLGYHAVARLARARMRSLPEPSRPPAPHGLGDGPDAHAAALDLLASFASPALPYQSRSARARESGSKLPAKRKKSGPPAPIYQVKITLRGAKPPIWRRLELRADTGLAELHHIIQVAFDWDDSHLHVFETAYGAFGTADAELGHRAEGPVTLEQVAPRAGDSLGYTYDFGDDWTHQIVVEKVVDRQPVAYPRCTGGRRAAPPEDCGGVWGYAGLLEVLADPGHPEHEDQMSWLGLDSAADFQPAAFDPADITRRLTGES